MSAIRRPVMPSTTCPRTTFNGRYREYLRFMEMCMKPPTGSPPLYLASSVTEETLVAKSDERLQSILATLEQCRAALVKEARPETAKLVSLAVLDLRIDISKLPDSDLKALCDAMTPPEGSSGRSNDPNSPRGPRKRAVLKLVK